jgi:hypothetical protein
MVESPRRQNVPLFSAQVKVDSRGLAPSSFVIVPTAVVLVVLEVVVPNAFRIKEVRALGTAPRGQGHRVDQSPGLRYLNDRRAAVADDEQRVGVPS